MEYNAISMLKGFALVEKASKMYDEIFAGSVAPRPSKTNRSHVPYIAEIIENPGITQDKLREMPLLHPSNISRALQHLEEDGFITRVASESDKRTNCLYPTEKAKSLKAGIQRALAGWSELILDGLSGRNKAFFFKMMEKIAANAEEYIKKHAK